MDDDVWHVGIFCCNEVERIGACIAAVDRAIGTHEGRIIVIVNGSTDGSAKAAASALVGIDRHTMLVEMDVADKATAINHFLYSSAGDLVFFVDGYVLVQPEAFDALAAAMRANKHANAASGVAVNGRTEAAFTQAPTHGRMSGGLFCLRMSFVNRLTLAGIALPAGLYRGDGLLGSMACYNLDPVSKPWNAFLCLSVQGARYEIYSLSLWRPSHYRRAFRRKVRQMRGLLENAAIKSIVHQRGFTALPRDCNAMIRDHVAVFGLPRVKLADRLFLELAWAGVGRG